MGLVDADGKPSNPEQVPAAWPMLRREMEKILENNLAFEQLRKVAELRKSCGVSGPSSTVIVRRPPRYGVIGA